MGNLFSIKCAMEKVGFKTKINTSRIETKEVDALILPGVGNFSAASKNLEKVRQQIIDLVNGGTPVLGICLGMQLLLEESEEGSGKGLALLAGKNLKLPNTVRVPHIGWNTIKVTAQNRLVEGLEDGPYFYFAHSYYATPISKEVISAETTYGVTFASIIAKNNIYGTQFHPEKSGRNGLKILENFYKMVKGR